MKQLYKKSPVVLLLAMLLFSLPATSQLNLPRGSQMAKVKSAHWQHRYHYYLFQTQR